MWFDGQRQPDTVYVASISRGKDSTAMLRAIQLLDFPLDMICSVDIWATEDIPAELPPMVAFKDEYDRKCQELFGIPVTRLYAQKHRSQIVNVERERERERESRTDGGARTPIYSIQNASRNDTGGTFTDSLTQSEDGARNSKQNMLTYEALFYKTYIPRTDRGGRKAGEKRIYGFAQRKGNWCQSMLKRAALNSLLQIARE